VEAGSPVNPCGRFVPKADMASAKDRNPWMRRNVLRRSVQARRYQAKPIGSTE
jgi:hypothetical protein